MPHNGKQYWGLEQFFSFSVFQMVLPSLDFIGVKTVRPNPAFVLAQDVFRNENLVRKRLFVEHLDRVVAPAVRKVYLFEQCSEPNLNKHRRQRV